MTELRVELYGTHVGQIREQRESFDFIVAPEGIRRFNLGSATLSFAVPLLVSRRPREAPTRRNFFDELLPEGKARSRLAGKAQIAQDYTVGMLERYGRDVAGAVKIWNPDAPGEPRTPNARPVSNKDIRTLLDNVARDPIGNSKPERMSSLAGVQDKIVLGFVDGQWAEPLDGFASTHIIKPIVGSLPSLIFDEEYGARIARHLGLAAFDTRVEVFDGRSALVIERYDRTDTELDRRLHQEDFNQALGYGGDAKYEAEGRTGGLKEIADLLRAQVSREAVDDLLRLTTLSVAVGNLDMHAKNISVLHLPDGSHKLAPAYDVVPQLHLVKDRNFAFAVNGVFRHDDITADDLITEGVRWRASNPEQIVTDTIAGVRDFVNTERPLPGAHPDLDRIIDGLCTTLTSPRRRPSTDSSSRRKDRGLGRTSRGGNGGSYAAQERHEADFELREPPNSPGGWGGPVP